MGKSTRKTAAATATAAPAMVVPANPVLGFVCNVVDIAEPIGRKEAERLGVPTTGTVALEAISGGLVPVPADQLQRAKEAMETIIAMVPENQFAADVRAALLDAMKAGEVTRHKAGYVAWIGKVIADHTGKAKALANALPVGKGEYDARFTGVRQVSWAGGIAFIHEFKTRCGAILSWWRNAPEKDMYTNDCYRISCTVKAAQVFKGELKHGISRPKFSKIASF